MVDEKYEDYAMGDDYRMINETPMHYIKKGLLKALLIHELCHIAAPYKYPNSKEKVNGAKFIKRQNKALCKARKYHDDFVVMAFDLNPDGIYPVHLQWKED